MRCTLPNKTYVFDLDGTIAPYKKDVPQHIADYINEHLGKVVIVTGGTSEYARKATANIKDKHVIGLADHCPSIDLAKAFRIPKWVFNNVEYLQRVRLAIAQQLNESLSGSGMMALCGGRSTIDMESRLNNKGSRVREWCGPDDIIFFYDCKWRFIEPYSNDYPLIKIAKKSIRTNWKRVIEDIEMELKESGYA